MDNLFESPIFGVFITLLAFFGANALRKRIPLAIFNPVLMATVSIIVVLVVFKIDIEAYNKGGDLLTFFLGPSIVALGVFFYEKYEEIKNDFIPFFIAVIVGGLMSIVSVVLILLLFNVPLVIVKSLASKSVTTPIAIEVSKMIGGIPEITAGIVILVGIFGNAFGPAILKFMGITSKSALGAALGTAAHGIGTARALEEGKLTGVYSGLAMCVNGIVTAVVTPYIIDCFL
ncbi:TIGR00659 family protein [Arenibacter nanhaiticus]|uniref:TIGR00659 family protein n=1 Tax=Arenibacter nanhaiticus TaxID=558155 RepID=A0A1M6GBP3_9FLAO|nr:LrgB family protein [Arenibacter nanhaiticus]SHJ07408.1 TIGR00659 family protein [Arenibacter nanhaiticus]